MKVLSETQVKLLRVTASLSDSIKDWGWREKGYKQSKRNPKDTRRNTTKSSIRDKAEGTFHEVKGKIKEVAGDLSDNSKLEAEGTAEKIAGKVQEKIGQVKKVWGE